MKYFLIILFISLIISTCIGFYIRTDDPKTGELVIGLSVAITFFVLMPLFIYHRWKDRDVREYMLTKENVDKMRQHSKDKKL